MDSWDILRLCVRYWKSFCATFVLVLGIGVFLALRSSSAHLPEPALEPSTADSNIDSSATPKQPESTPHSSNKPTIHYYQFPIMLAKLDSRPIIPEPMLLDALKDFSCTKPNEQPESTQHSGESTSSTQEAPQAPISLIPESGACIIAIEKSYDAIDLVYIISLQAYEPAKAQNLARQIDFSIRTNPFIKDLQASITELATIAWRTKDAQSSWKSIELARASKNIARPEIKEIKEIKGFVQTSKRSKLILAVLSALILSFLVVFVRDFFAQNAHRLRPQA